MGIIIGFVIFVPKIIATFAVLIACSSWIIAMMSQFAVEVFAGFPKIVNM